MTAGSDQPAREIVLQPGEVWFGEGRVRLRTLLGSCVAVTLWHPQRKIGGMCHYLLGERPANHGIALDGRYAPDALALLLRGIRRYDADPADFHGKLFGGGRMFDLPAAQLAGSVPERNVAMAEAMMQRHRIPVLARHLGGGGHRSLAFELWSGDVWVRHRQAGAADAGLRMEARP